MSEAKIVVSAQDNASKVLQQVRSSMGDVQASGAQLAGTLAGLGIAFSAVTATAWVKNIIDGVDALNDIKDATGSSIENISALEDVAARTGTRFELVGDALTKFNKVLSDAKPGSAAEETLKNLGLSAKELKDIDPAEALLKFSVALNGFADDGNKARAVQDLLGKSFKDLAPLLKNLAEVGQLNATVTTEQAEQAELFNKQLFILEKNAKDAGRALTSDLVIGINKASQAMRDNGFWEGLSTLLTGDDQYKSNVKMVELTDQLLKAENQLSQSRAQDAKDGGRTSRTAAAERRVALIKEELATVQNYRKFIDDTLKKPEEAPKPKLPETIAGTKDKVKTKAEEITDEQRALASYVQGLQTTLDTTVKLSEEQKALNFLKSIGTAGEIEQVRELVLGQAKQVDGLKEQAEATKLLNEERKASEQYLETLQKELQAMGESNQKLQDQVEEIGLTKEALDALHLARLDNTISQLEQNRATADAIGLSYEEVSALEQKISLLKEQRQLTATGQIRQAQADTRAEADKASKDFADTLHNDLKGAFSAAFRDTQDPLKAFGDALENVVFTRAATALADALAEAAIQQAAQSNAGSIGSGIGGFIASLFPSFDGGGTTGAAGRTGGLDGKGGFMAMLHPQETVLDHTKGQTGSGGGAVTITQNIQIDSRSDQASIMAAMYQAKEMAKAEILRSRQRGGVFA